MKKIYIFILIPLTALSVLFFTLPKAHAIENDVINLASPDLTDKQYLDNAIYRLHNYNGITIDYNTINGHWIFNGSTTAPVGIQLLNLETNTQYALSYIAISGTLTGGLYFFSNPPVVEVLFQINDNVDKTASFITSTQNQFRIDITTGETFNNYTFKLQIEKGLTATAYQVPLDALEQHYRLTRQDNFLQIVGAWITGMLGWITNGISAVIPIFYTAGPEGGFTFIGMLALFGIAVGIVSLVIAFVRGFL